MAVIPILSVQISLHFIHELLRRWGRISNHSDKPGGDKLALFWRVLHVFSVLFHVSSSYYFVLGNQVRKKKKYWTHVCKKQIPERALGKLETNSKFQLVAVFVSVQSCYFHMFSLFDSICIFQSFTKLLLGPRIASSKNHNILYNILLIVGTNIQ